MYPPRGSSIRKSRTRPILGRRGRPEPRPSTRRICRRRGRRYPPDSGAARAGEPATRSGARIRRLEKHKFGRPPYVCMPRKDLGGLIRLVPLRDLQKFVESEAKKDAGVERRFLSRFGGLDGAPRVDYREQAEIMFAGVDYMTPYQNRLRFGDFFKAAKARERQGQAAEAVRIYVEVSEAIRSNYNRVDGLQRALLGGLLQSGGRDGRLHRQTEGGLREDPAHRIPVPPVHHQRLGHNRGRLRAGPHRRMHRSAGSGVPEGPERAHTPREARLQSHQGLLPGAGARFFCRPKCSKRWESGRPQQSCSTGTTEGA